MMSKKTLTAAAREILLTPHPVPKAERSLGVARQWQRGEIRSIGAANAPDRPAQPERPLLMLPKDMPKRRSAGSLSNRIAMLHAVAHIELNAINLAWDIICRFAHDTLPKTFFDDWVSVGCEEAEHFLLLNTRLAALDATYGDLPAHDGLWQAADSTRHNLLDRLAIVPLVFEARGLDVTPGMIRKFKNVGDNDSAIALQKIYDEEIGHVAAGIRWYEWQCRREGKPPEATWKALVKQHYAGQLKPPFNEEARSAANFPPSYYLMESAD